MKSSRIFFVLMLLATAPLALPSHADVVTDWNGITVPIVAAERPGPPGLFDIALVQAAVHDAVQSVEGRFEPYAYDGRVHRGAGSPDAAAAAAAYRTLVLLYPSREAALSTIYDAYLASRGLVADPALAAGEEAAAALHAAHYRTPLPAEPFYGETAIGRWRSSVPMAFVYAAQVKPFTLQRPSQFRPGPPPPLASAQYALEYRVVKTIGAASAHPSSGTEIARFWSVDFVRQWNDALCDAARQHVTSTGDSARLFALANLAAADAFIAVWDSKLHYNFWRPSTAIRQGDADYNHGTAGDPTWAALIADPPYPEYVSGANGLTGAFTRMMQLFFGTDEIAFSVKTTSPLVAAPERHYNRISDAAREVVEARIYLGIHFRSADVEGRRLGGRVAQWTFSRVLRPVPGGQVAFATTSGAKRPRGR